MTDTVMVALIGLATASAAGIFALWQTRRTSSVTERAADLAAEASDRISVMENLQQFVNQLQEQLAAERASRQADAQLFRAEVLDLRADVAAAMRGIRARDDYISRLRRHINDQLPPPPPEYPPELAA